MWDFTLTGMYDTLRSTLDFVATVERSERIVIVAASLAARPGIRLAAEDARVAGLIGIVGVVNTRYTLAKVFGSDHAALSIEEIPPDGYVEFERKRIGGIGFYRDWYAGHWVDVEGTHRDIARVQCPIVNFCGSADDWVDVAEVKNVFATAGGLAHVIELPFVEHELAKNPVAARMLLLEVTRSTLAYARDEQPNEQTVAEPDFAQLAAQIPYERRVERERIAPTSTTSAKRGK
jgi:hypothetical protein